MQLNLSQSWGYPASPSPFSNQSEVLEINLSSNFLKESQESLVSFTVPQTANKVNTFTNLMNGEAQGFTPFADSNFISSSYSYDDFERFPLNLEEIDSDENSITSVENSNSSEENPISEESSSSCEGDTISNQRKPKKTRKVWRYELTPEQALEKEQKRINRMSKNRIAAQKSRDKASALQAEMFSHLEETVKYSQNLLREAESLNVLFQDPAISNLLAREDVKMFHTMPIAFNKDTKFAVISIAMLAHEINQICQQAMKDQLLAMKNENDLLRSASLLKSNL